MKFAGIFVICLCATINLIDAGSVIRDFNLEFRIQTDKCRNETAENPEKCALEHFHLLNPDGSLKMDNFVGLYKEAAEECKSHKDAQSSNGLKYDKFLMCYMSSVNVKKDQSYQDCAKEFGKEIPTDLDDEAIKKDDKLACSINCICEKYSLLNEDGDFIMDKLISSEQTGWDIDGVAKKCMDDNKQEDKCKKGALRFSCMDKAFREERERRNRNRD